MNNTDLYIIEDQTELHITDYPYVSYQSGKKDCETFAQYLSLDANVKPLCLKKMFRL